MNLIVIPRLCLKCARTTGAESEDCPQCGEPLVSAVMKLLTVNDKPVPETKEFPEPGELVWTLDSVKTKVEKTLALGYGRNVCSCGQALTVEDLRMYPHEGGDRVEGLGKVWLYLHCPKCQYDWSLWKLGISFGKPDSDLKLPQTYFKH